MFRFIKRWWAWIYPKARRAQMLEMGDFFTVYFTEYGKSRGWTNLDVACASFAALAAYQRGAFRGLNADGLISAAERVAEDRVAENRI